MELLLLLLSAHFIGDFYLQKLSWVTCRNKNHYKSKGLAKHIGVHALLCTAVFWYSATPLIAALISLIVITSTHYVTDVWKSYQKNSLSFFVVDQCIHLFIILCIWLYITATTWHQISLFINTVITAKYLIIVFSYLLVCRPASIMIALALQKHTYDLMANTNTLQNNENVGLVSAGAWIGYIERCLAVSFILTGHFAGIGFLVATKTIFRFGDLTQNKDMKLTEYMMIGTLLSYAIAIFIGWLALKLYLIM